MIDGGFHYPQDWGYKVQNFSSIRYTRELSAGEEATFMYPFMAAELAGGRSYGLQLNLHYSANQCKSTYRIFRSMSILRLLWHFEIRTLCSILAPPQYYSEAFYNETVEVAENMDNATAEHFFMFLTLVIFGGLVFLYFASKVAPKKGKTVVETGTAVLSDSSWIPQEHMKSTTPTSSPNARRRKAE